MDIFEKLKEIGKENSEYDPEMFGAMVVLVIFTAGVIFWIFWVALVYQGGIFLKLKALFWLLGKKRFSELVPPGLPLSESVFGGWLANFLATLVILGMIVFLYYFYRKRFGQK